MSAPGGPATPGPATAGHALPMPEAETEGAIADDLVRRGLLVAPAVLVLAWLAAGGPGAASAALALGLVLLNFLVASRSLTWSARISPGLYIGMAFGGYFVRLVLISGVVFAVRDASWVDLPTVGITLAATHLALLAWELRAVSLTLAFPGLKPGYSRASVTKGAAE